MRTYELMYILRPDMAEEDVDKQSATFEGNFTNAGGVIKSVEKMGKRRLAYIVRGFREGNYVLMTLEGDGKAIHELERRMRVTEPVIKFLTVRVDEEQKRIDKIKKIRATKVKRRPEPVAPVGVAAAPKPLTPASTDTPAEGAEAAPEAPASEAPAPVTA